MRRIQTQGGLTIIFHNCLSRRVSKYSCELEAVKRVPEKIIIMRYDDAISDALDGRLKSHIEYWYSMQCTHLPLRSERLSLRLRVKNVWTIMRLRLPFDQLDSIWRLNTYNIIRGHLNEIFKT